MGLVNPLALSFESLPSHCKNTLLPTKLPQCDHKKATCLHPCISAKKASSSLQGSVLTPGPNSSAFHSVSAVFPLTANLSSIIFLHDNWSFHVLPNILHSLSLSYLKSSLYRVYSISIQTLWMDAVSVESNCRRLGSRSVVEYEPVA